MSAHKSPLLDQIVELHRCLEQLLAEITRCVELSEAVVREQLARSETTFFMGEGAS